MPEPTARDCLTACERLEARLDWLHAEMLILPPVDPAEIDAMCAQAEAALALWGDIELPELPDLPEPEALDWPPAEWDGGLLPDPPRL